MAHSVRFMNCPKQYQARHSVAWHGKASQGYTARLNAAERSTAMPSKPRITTMKTRKEAAKYINSGKCMNDGRFKGKYNHFGLMAVRKLMDFIYENEPKTKKELINNLDKLL